jgi:xylulokinase
MSKSEAWCRTIADVFEAETVPVEGEGAALGAALHAAWVWTKESGKAGRSVKLTDVVEPFIKLDETRRVKPDPANVAAYRAMKKAYFAISGRVRGIGGDDPFVLRSRMVG